MKGLRTCIATTLKSHPGAFLEVRVFGSALTSDRPKDVDFLVVYDEGRPPSEVADEVSQFADSLTMKLGGTMVHVTALSRQESEELGFLDDLGEIVFKARGRYP